MKCSSCSEVVRPLVALDIDGTLGDYHSHFLGFASSYLGKTNEWWNGSPAGHPPHGPDSHIRLPRLYDGSMRFKEWVCWAAVISEPIYADIKLAYRQGAQKRTMPLYPSAATIATEIRRLGADLWLTTTRPYLRLDGIDPDTREWARRHQIPYDGLLYDRYKYQILGDRIDPARVVAVLDDLGYLYDQAEEVFGSAVPILSKTRWNEGVDRPNQVSGLDWAFGFIEERINQWKEQHD